MEQELLYRYIKGDVSAEEKKQIAAWSLADPKNKAELLTLHRLNDAATWNRCELEIFRKEKRRRRLHFFIRIAAAAVVCLLAVNSYLYISHLKSSIPESRMQTIHVPAGQRMEVILADGTSVWLNAGSTFSFPTLFASDKREVFLNGEGYFNVTKSEEQPFIVNTSSYDIKVFGTEFNVLAYQSSHLFEVSLIKGCVEVYSASEKVLLEPDSRAFLQDNHLVRDKIDNYDELMWKDGLICFNDETVESMISKLELYYDVKIVIQNMRFTQQRYVGKFRTKDGIEHILKVFQHNDNYTYERDDENNIITIK